MKFIDKVLDSISMYRLTLYYLLFLLAGAMVMGATGYISYKPLAIALSAGYLSLICYVSNKIFAYAYEVPAAIESPLITALILSLIITPLASSQGLIFLTAAGGLAMASKYILTINKKHIFNPAAVAVALTAIGAGDTASWWVSSSHLLPLVVLGGVLLVRKIQRWQMVLSFLAATLIATAVYTLIGGGGVSAALHRALLHSPLFFLAFVMLIEPLTSPAVKLGQRWYGALAGILLPPQVHIFSLYSTPELALVASNIFSYLITPKVKLLPKLAQKHKLAPDVVDFVFSNNQKFSYKPGQYTEWTLPHAGADARGNRRYFTLASSPTEDNLRLGVKFYSQSSSFKQAMLVMDNDTPIAVAQLGGDFTMPEDKAEKLAFIAGGIGITPFRSMTKYLLDTNDNRSVSMLYSAKNANELVYTNVFEVARRKLGHSVTYVLTGQSATLPAGAKPGPINAKLIKAQIPDYAERTFYISGTHTMVKAMTDILRGLGVARSRIKTDFFPGYV